MIGETTIPWLKNRFGLVGRSEIYRTQLKIELRIKGRQFQNWPKQLKS